MTTTNSRIFIENIGVGLIDLSNLYNLDLKTNEYLVVGQRNNKTTNTIDNEYNFIVNNNGVGINATRKELRDTNAGLLVNNNIICNGTITARNLKLDNLNVDSSLTSNVLLSFINKINSNLLFFNGYNNNLLTNIYTPYNVSIGNLASTYSNSHLFKISDSPIGKVENLQFAIFNNINNQFEPSKLTMGMLGYNQNTPASINTTYGMPFEFHISKPSTKIDELYSNGLGLPEYKDNNNYPQLAIDINGCVNINKNKYDGSAIINPKLFVNGSALISNIYMYDVAVKSNLPLDDIYIKKNGLTLNPDQIKGGNFTKQEFTFNSNVNIGKAGDNYLLTVNNSANITNTLTTDNLIACKTTINGTADFNQLAYFNANVIFNEKLTFNKSINVSNDIFVDGFRLTTSNHNYSTNTLNFDAGCNLNISGRFGTGILNTDTYDHQFNIIKRNKDRFEVYMEDLAGITTDSSKVYMGHTILNNLYGNIDNSFVILTQKNIRWHNIYFYPGKDKEGCHSFKTFKPTLAIMQNNRVGINNNLPQKTLDITGDLITDDYYIRKNNIEFKINDIYIRDNNSCLDATSFDINLDKNIIYKNKKTLNVTGGINSYDGYYNNDYKLGSFHIYPNHNNISSITENQVGIGIFDTGNNYSVPLNVRNNTTGIFNNSIIRLYRGLKGGGFNNSSSYTGIDFCDYDMPIKSQNRNFYKWFVYKNNNNSIDNVGTLQIGYTDNSYNPTHSCMNFYYNQTNKKYFIDINNPIVDYRYDPLQAVSIKGNVEIEGSINLKGTNNYYKINGAIIGSFSNSSTLKDTVNSTTGYTTELNDISIIGNKLIYLPTKSIIVGYKDDWIFNKINNIQNTTNFSCPLFIYNNKDYYDDVLPPVITKFYNKSFKNYVARPDIAIIELGILTDTNDEGLVNNKVDFKLKGYNNNLTVFEITPNNNNPFITCINKDNKNQINIGNVKFYNSSNVEYENTCVHINDDYNCLLKLTNNNKPVNINLTCNNYSWDVNAGENLSFDLNSKKIMEMNNNYFILSNTSALINANVNKPAIELTNTYLNSLISSSTPTTNTGFITIPNSNIIHEYKSYHYDTYDDNFDTNISIFKYKVDDSNLPTNQFTNYYINNSNLIYNNTRIFNVNYNIYNAQVDYKYLDEVKVDVNTKTYEIIPTLKTFNPNLTATIKGDNTITKTYNINNNNLILNYKLPKTVFNDQLYIESTINTLAFINQSDKNVYCNLRLTTFLKVKDKTLFDYNLKTLYNEFLINANGSNYYINTVNNIYYYPVPNINVSNIEINYNYNYNYRNEIELPKNFYNNYNNTINVISQNENNIIIHNSNTYFKNEIETLDITNFKKVDYMNLNKIIKLIPITINGITIAEMPLSITKRDYFEVFNFGTNKVDIKLPIYINNYLPHLILKNNINSKFSSSHKIYSYNNNYEIFLDNNKLISIDSNANLNTNGSIQIKDIYFTGDIYSKNGNIITSITSNLTHIIGNDFYIHKNNISMNSSNIILNPSILNKGGVIINSSSVPTSSNNLFQINNYKDNDNFITLKSISKSAFVHFHTTADIYKFGTSNNTFGIWKTTDPSQLQCSYIDNNFNTYSNLMLFYTSNNSNIININGHIKTTNDIQINDITAYVNNPIKLRIFGNIKIDGDLLSSSDKRLKTNINKIENPLEKIETLTGITFNNISNNNKKGTGLIAQEVLKVIPEAVYEDENGYLSIAYGNLIGLLIEGIKELNKKIKI
jgi:Chaperone of endosialidase